MSESTIIAWTDHTANFWMGCTKVSAGCDHCYAETLTTNRMGLHVWGRDASRQAAKGIWANVEKWNRGARDAGVQRKVFCMSLGDFFENNEALAPVRARAWNVMRESESLVFQVLTKRPQNIAKMLPADWGDGWPNVWLGTSIENNAVVKRADFLRVIPAVVRFVSYEPAIGPLDRLDLSGIDWLICGGESGPGYRPFDHQWARDIRTRCEDNGTAFFFKQSAAYRTEIGIELDGKIVRNYPIPRNVERALSATLF